MASRVRAGLRKALVAGAVLGALILAAFVATGRSVASAAPLVVDFKQCANHDSPNPLGTCHWINSILKQTNSRYVEGMSSLLRLIFTNIPSTSGNVHTLTFTHEATEGSAAARQTTS